MIKAIDGAVSFLRGRSTIQPSVGVILGSGLGNVVDSIDVDTAIPYSEIPGAKASTVLGHQGRLILGHAGNVPVAIMQGRVHFYEGYEMDEVMFLARVMGRLGIKTMIVTNAAGGVNTSIKTGDLMLISDHINLLGDNPLVGPNDDALGPRFPDMSAPYDEALRALARAVALDLRITLREGVYVAVPGPNLETPAEYRMLRTLGADVVGMSTVPEVIVAVHGGMRVLGISIITDQCLPDALEPASLETIIATATRAEPDLTRLVRGVLERL